MTTLFDWVKLGLNNKWLIILLFGSVTGAVGNVTQYFEVEAAQEETIHAQHQVAAVAQAYHKHYAIKPGNSIKPNYEKRIRQLEEYHR